MFAQEGCKEVGLNPEESGLHELACQFRTLVCIVPECNAMIGINRFEEHLQSHRGSLNYAETNQSKLSKVPK